MDRATFPVDVVDQLAEEFVRWAVEPGRDRAKFAEAWELVTGVSGYAFCKAESTPYGLEPYQTRAF